MGKNKTRKLTPEEKAAKKFAEMFGLSEVLEEEVQQKEILQGNLHGVSEEKINERRGLQGILYYLRAPDLFTFRKCNNCGTDFAVSRLQVAYCSYNCIRDSLKAMGLEWSRSKDMELIVKESYDGNEPLWLSSETLVSLETALKRLLEARSQDTEKETPTPSTTPQPQENLASEPSVSEEPTTSVSTPGPQVSEKNSTLESTTVSSTPSFTSRPSTKSSGKRRITFS